MKLAVCFAGQGSQHPHMGEAIYHTYPQAKALIDQASGILGYSLPHLMYEDDPRLNQTIYTQPAILTTSLAIYEAVKQVYDLDVNAILGFSLGEYSALHALGVFDYAQIVKLISIRAQLMDACAKANPGSMAAFINPNKEALARVCLESSIGDEIVQIANYNSPMQLVIAGHDAAVERVIARQADTGARRVSKLNVSGAFHSPLMQEAAGKMHQVIDSVAYERPNTTWITNVTGDVYDQENLASLLEAQIVSPVQFIKSVQTLKNLGITHVLEIGPGSVLQGLIKKTDDTLKVMSVNTLEDIQAIGDFLCD